MQAAGRYDGTLQMFIQEARDADARYLRFLRWLAERGELEHEVAGPAAPVAPTGPTMLRLADPSPDGS